MLMIYWKCAPNLNKYVIDNELQFSNPITKIMVMRKIKWHSCHQWIFRLMRNMMTYLLYIGYQDFTGIHTEKGIPLCMMSTLPWEPWCSNLSFIYNQYMMLDNNYFRHIRACFCRQFWHVVGYRDIIKITFNFKELW
jgi:hypothetical protein